jgi:hypothetical protein
MDLFQECLQQQRQDAAWVDQISFVLARLCPSLPNSRRVKRGWLPGHDESDAAALPLKYQWRLKA